MTRLIVVRHGYSTANDCDAFAGQTDVPLTEKGMRQAEHVAAYLAAHERIDRIIYSDMTRTRQTAAPAAKLFGLPLFADAALRELFAGVWENRPFAEIARCYPEDWWRWIFDFAHARCTLGESVREHYFRIQNAILRIARENEGKTVLLVTHCTPLRILNAMAKKLPPERIDEAEFPANASINIYNLENGELTVEKTGIIAFPTSVSASKRFPPPPFLPKHH